METIIISEDFKEAIANLVEQSESSRADHILRDMVESGCVDDEFGHLIFGEEEQYNVQADLEVLDAIEDEIKLQLLKKYNNQN